MIFLSYKPFLEKSLLVINKPLSGYTLSVENAFDILIEKIIHFAYLENEYKLTTNMPEDMIEGFESMINNKEYEIYGNKKIQVIYQGEKE